MNLGAVVFYMTLCGRELATGKYQRFSNRVDYCGASQLLGSIPER